MDVVGTVTSTCDRDRSSLMSTCKVISFHLISIKKSGEHSFIQLFREKLSEKVHATIPNGIVGGF